MTNFAKDLRHARPRLILASPLRYFLVLGMIVFNLAIGSWLYIQHDNHSLSIYSPYFNSSVYGVMFIIVALTLAIGLIINHWGLMRNSLLAGLFFKSLFAYSLIALTVKNGWQTTGGVVQIWLFIMWIQFCLYIFFSPRSFEGESKWTKLNL